MEANKERDSTTTQVQQDIDHFKEQYLHSLGINVSRTSPLLSSSLLSSPSSLACPRKDSVSSVGTRRDSVGTRRDSVGTRRDSVGTRRDSVGTRRESVSSSSSQEDGVLFSPLAAGEDCFSGLLTHRATSSSSCGRVSKQRTIDSTSTLQYADGTNAEPSVLSDSSDRDQLKMDYIKSLGLSHRPARPKGMHCLKDRVSQLETLMTKSASSVPRERSLESSQNTAQQNIRQSSSCTFSSNQSSHHFRACKPTSSAVDNSDAGEKYQPERGTRKYSAPLSAFHSGKGTITTVVNTQRSIPNFNDHFQDDGPNSDQSLHSAELPVSPPLHLSSFPWPCDGNFTYSTSDIPKHRVERVLSLESRRDIFEKLSMTESSSFDSPTKKITDFITEQSVIHKTYTDKEKAFILESFRKSGGIQQRTLSLGSSLNLQTESVSDTLASKPQPASHLPCNPAQSVTKIVNRFEDASHIKLKSKRGLADSETNTEGGEKLDERSHVVQRVAGGPRGERKITLLSGNEDWNYKDTHTVQNDTHTVQNDTHTVQEGTHPEQLEVTYTVQLDDTHTGQDDTRTMKDDASTELFEDAPIVQPGDTLTYTVRHDDTHTAQDDTHTVPLDDIRTLHSDDKRTVQLDATYTVKDDTHTSYTDDTHTSYPDDTHTSYTDDTHTSYTDDTHTSYTDDTHTSYPDDTHPSYTDDTHTSYTDDTHTSYTDDTHTSYPDDTHISYPDDTHTSYTDDTHTLHHNDTHTLHHDGTYTLHHNGTVQDDTYTVQNDTHTEQEDTHTVQDDTHTVQDDTHTVHDDTRAVQDDTHTVHDNTHTVQDNTHTLESNTYAAHGDTQTVKGETQAVKGETLAVKDETLAVESNCISSDTGSQKLHDLREETVSETVLESKLSTGQENPENVWTDKNNEVWSEGSARFSRESFEQKTSSACWQNHDTVASNLHKDVTATRQPKLEDFTIRNSTCSYKVKDSEIYDDTFINHAPSVDGIFDDSRGSDIIKDIYSYKQRDTSMEENPHLLDECSNVRFHPICTLGSTEDKSNLIHSDICNIGFVDASSFPSQNEPEVYSLHHLEDNSSSDFREVPGSICKSASEASSDSDNSFRCHGDSRNVKCRNRGGSRDGKTVSSGLEIKQKEEYLAETVNRLPGRDVSEVPGTSCRLEAGVLPAFAHDGGEQVSDEVVDNLRSDRGNGELNVNSDKANVAQTRNAYQVLGETGQEDSSVCNVLDDTFDGIMVDRNVLDGGVLYEDVLDGGVLDGGVLDEGVFDGNVLDGSVFDGGVLDVGVLGVGVLDRGVLDGTVLDGNLLGLGVLDGNLLDGNLLGVGVLGGGVLDGGVLDGTVLDGNLLGLGVLDGNLLDGNLLGVGVLGGGVLDGGVLDGTVLDGNLLGVGVLDGNVLDGNLLGVGVLGGGVLDGGVLDGGVLDGNLLGVGVLGVSVLDGDVLDGGVLDGGVLGGGVLGGGVLGGGVLDVGVLGVGVLDGTVLDGNLLGVGVVGGGVLDGGVLGGGVLDGGVLGGGVLDGGVLDGGVLDGATPEESLECGEIFDSIIDEDRVLQVDLHIGTSDTVSLKQEDIDTVSLKQEDMDTVSLKQEDIDTVSLKQEDMGTVSLKQEDIDTVSLKQEDMDTVSLKQEDMDTVSLKQEDIDTVSLKQEDMDTVSLKQEDIDNVSLKQEDMDTVSLNQEDIDTESFKQEDMDTVASNTSLPKGMRICSAVDQAVGQEHLTNIRDHQLTTKGNDGQFVSYTCKYGVPEHDHGIACCSCGGNSLKELVENLTVEDLGENLKNITVQYPVRHSAHACDSVCPFVEHGDAASEASHFMETVSASNCFLQHESNAVESIAHEVPEAGESLAYMKTTCVCEKDLTFSCEASNMESKDSAIFKQSMASERDVLTRLCYDLHMFSQSDELNYNHQVTYGHGGRPELADNENMRRGIICKPSIFNIEIYASSLVDGVMRECGFAFRNVLPANSKIISGELNANCQQTCVVTTAELKAALNRETSLQSVPESSKHFPGNHIPVLPVGRRFSDYDRGVQILPDSMPQSLGNECFNINNNDVPGCGSLSACIAETTGSMNEVQVNTPSCVAGDLQDTPLKTSNLYSSTRSLDYSDIQADFSNTQQNLPRSSNTPEILPRPSNAPDILPRSSNAPDILPGVSNTPDIMPGVSNTPGILFGASNTPEIMFGTSNAPEFMFGTSNAPEFLSRSLNTPEIMYGALNTPEIQPEALNTPEILYGALNTPEIQPVPSNTQKIQPEASNTPEVQSKGFNTHEIQSEASNTPEIYSEASNTPEIQSEASNTPDIQSEASNTPEIQPEASNSPEIQTEASNTPEIQSEASNAPEIQPEASNTPEIQPEASNTPEIQSEASNAPEIQPEASNTPEIQPEASNTPEIQSEASNTPDIQPEASNSPEIQPEASNTPEIQSEASNAPEIQPEASNTPEIHPAESNTPEIQSEASNTPEIQSEASNTPEIQSEASNTPEIQSEASNTPEIQSEASNTPEIQPEASNTPEIQSEALNIPEIQPEASNTPDIQSEASNTPEIQSEASNTPEIQSEASNTPEIQYEASNTPEVQSVALNTPVILPRSSNTPEIQPEVSFTSEMLPVALHMPEILSGALNAPEILPVAESGVFYVRRRSSDISESVESFYSGTSEMVESFHSVDDKEVFEDSNKDRHRMGTGNMAALGGGTLARTDVSDLSCAEKELVTNSAGTRIGKILCEADDGNGLKLVTKIYGLPETQINEDGSSNTFQNEDLAKDVYEGNVTNKEFDCSFDSEAPTSLENQVATSLTGHAGSDHRETGVSGDCPQDDKNCNYIMDVSDVRLSCFPSVVVVEACTTANINAENMCVQNDGGVRQTLERDKGVSSESINDDTPSIGNKLEALIQKENGNGRFSVEENVLTFRNLQAEDHYIENDAVGLSLSNVHDTLDGVSIQFTDNELQSQHTERNTGLAILAERCITHFYESLSCVSSCENADNVQNNNSNVCIQDTSGFVHQHDLKLDCSVPTEAYRDWSSERNVCSDGTTVLCAKSHDEHISVQRSDDTDTVISVKVAEVCVMAERDADGQHFQDKNYDSNTESCGDGPESMDRDSLEDDIESSREKSSDIVLDFESHTTTTSTSTNSKVNSTQQQQSFVFPDYQEQQNESPPLCSASFVPKGETELTDDITSKASDLDPIYAVVIDRPMTLGQNPSTFGLHGPQSNIKEKRWKEAEDAAASGVNTSIRSPRKASAPFHLDLASTDMTEAARVDMEEPIESPSAVLHRIPSANAFQPNPANGSRLDPYRFLERSQSDASLLKRDLEIMATDDDVHLTAAESSSGQNISECNRVYLDLSRAEPFERVELGESAGAMMRTSSGRLLETIPQDEELKTGDLSYVYASHRSFSQESSSSMEDLTFSPKNKNKDCAKYKSCGKTGQDNSITSSKSNLRSSFQIYSHSLKQKVRQLQMGSVPEQLNALTELNVLMEQAWSMPIYGKDLAYELCDILRTESALEIIVSNLASNNRELMKVSARLLEQSLTTSNRRQVAESGLELVVKMTHDARGDCELAQICTGILESLFKTSEDTCARVIKMGGLDTITYWCRCNDRVTLKNCAIALSNLALYGGGENQQEMAKHKVPEWLFPLAFVEDDSVRYYALLAIGVLVSNKEIESAVTSSGTLALVLPFIDSHDPAEFAERDTSHRHGRSPGWLKRLIPVLSSKREEAQALAAFHFVMEAGIKSEQGRKEVLYKIGSVDPLKWLASTPNRVASKLAAQALKIIGEEIPHKLSQQVPLWTCDDVVHWTAQVGFGTYADKFKSSHVDGDLLLRLTEEELRDSLNMSCAITRKRFLRELRDLKISSDYTSCDPSMLGAWLQEVGEDMSQYTYQMLNQGVDRQLLRSLTDLLLLNDCKIVNGIHRMKILSKIEELRSAVSSPSCARFDSIDGMCAPHNPLKNPIDVFISYRRSNGSQLASLLKVHLQLRGFTVFIDIEKLKAGKFDESLLESVRQAKNFIIVLTQNSLDRCMGDEEKKDWVHREITAAIDAGSNIIPLLDNFRWPSPECLPDDMRSICYFNAVRWIHDYQDACVDKLEKFLRGETNPQMQHPVSTASTTSVNSKLMSGFESPNSPPYQRAQGMRKMSSVESPVDSS